MSGLVKERLPGCNAESLDAYLRGLGFFLLAGRIEPSVRAWWDERGVMTLASEWRLSEIVATVAIGVRKQDNQLAPAVRTPWKGTSQTDKGRSFVRARNEASDAELPWFDACAVLRDLSDGWAPSPLLLQGEPKFRSDLQAGHADALKLLRETDEQIASSSLLAAVLGDPLGHDAPVTGKKLFGPYQSGRATGPGHSQDDRELTSGRVRKFVGESLKESV